MTTVDLRPGAAVLALPDDSDADVTITAVDSAGDAVDLTGNTFTLDILSDGSVLLTATMDHTDIATGVIVAGFDDDDLAAITATGLRWRLRNTTDEKNWITGPCSVSSDGTASSASQSVSVVVDSSTLTVTLGAVGAGPAGAAGATGADGTDGNTVLYGSGAPDDGADGVDGNFYIDTDGPTLYGPKAAGSWPAGVSMVGPAGSGSGDVIGPASATDNAVVLFDGTTGKLVKDSTVVLGDSASKNVGTTAGTVAAGDDSRLSDDRDPNAHASDHETGGGDAITSLAASVIDSGMIDAARLGSGTADSTTFLRGDQTYATPAGGGVSWGRPKPDGGSAGLAFPGVSFDKDSRGASRTLAVDRLYYEPRVFPKDCTIDQLVLEVKTAATSGAAGSAVIRVGVYTADDDFQPVTLVVDGGDLACGSTGIKTASISASISAGPYVFVLHSDGNPTLAAYIGSGALDGVSTTFSTGSNYPWVTTMYKSSVAVGALPSTPTKWDTLGAYSTPFDHSLACRIASY